MKKSLAFLVVLVVTIACGPKKEKKKSFEYKRTTTEKKAEKKAIEKAPVNFENVGIGPIKSMNGGTSLDTILIF